MDLMERIRDMKGVGEKTEKLYAKLGIYTISDLLLNFPRTYLQYPTIANYDEIVPDKDLAIYASIKAPAIVRKGRRMDVTLATGFFGDRSVELVWYRMPYIRSQLHAGESYVFYGKVTEKNHRLQMQQPEIYTIEQYQKLQIQPQPVYTLTKGLSNHAITKAVETVLNDGTDIGDYLPTELRIKRELAPMDWAMNQIHFPMDFDALVKARQRFVYDEFFFFLMEMQLQKQTQVLEENTWQTPNMLEYQRVYAELPFELTKGQQECLDDVLDDINGPYVSQRLIQGDVGSGKTIVAFLSMLLMASNGYQSAIMAPTEVLARQHAIGFAQMCKDYDLPYEVVLLVGSMTAKEKREAYAKIASTESLFIVGTHALIQEKVEYRQLGLVVTDEQHRFGVKQRKVFSQKGNDPHVLVMSATPIPRTLAMILYGDMKLSVIRDVPARRLPIKNAVIKETSRPTAYKFILKEVHAGHQAYVICPLVDASEKTEAENVTEYQKTLQDFYGSEVTVGLLHGKMKATEKNRVMDDFASGKIQVLVSTTVVEVGVNVPNATVMMIENANRFGLAQLHQLRGRVGRGDAQSYCILMDSSQGPEMSKRLEILQNSNDGFEIASQDLKMRGPGDFYGIRQSGDMNFKLADIYQDAGQMEQAAQDVADILAIDPELSLEVHRGINKYMSRRRLEVYTNL